MLRLSIVIPALRPVELLENSLVSVLQNRPADTEILIVHTQPYDDPHGLEGEVRFLAADPKASFVEAVNQGFTAARAPVVHLLGSAAEVSEGWTVEPLKLFADPQVAAVAPLVLDLSNPARAISTGICYSRGGKARHRTAGRSAVKAARAKGQVLGPSAMAAFYRKSALHQLGGFERSVGDVLADVDLALQIRASGWECRFEAQSLVYAEQPAAAPAGFAASRCAERLFRRHAAQFGWASSLALHPFTVAGGFIGSIPRIAAFTGLLGRLGAWLEGPAWRGLRPASDQLTAPATPAQRNGVRMDAAHPRARRDAEKRGSWVPAQE